MRSLVASLTNCWLSTCLKTWLEQEARLPLSWVPSRPLCKGSDQEDECLQTCSPCNHSTSLDSLGCFPPHPPYCWTPRWVHQQRNHEAVAWVLPEVHLHLVLFFLSQLLFGWLSSITGHQLTTSYAKFLLPRPLLDQSEITAGHILTTFWSLIFTMITRINWLDSLNNRFPATGKTWILYIAENYK